MLYIVVEGADGMLATAEFIDGEKSASALLSARGSEGRVEAYKQVPEKSCLGLP